MQPTPLAMHLGPRHRQNSVLVYGVVVLHDRQTSFQEFKERQYMPDARRNTPKSHARLESAYRLILEYSARWERVHLVQFRARFTGVWSKLRQIELGIPDCTPAPSRVLQHRRMKNPLFEGTAPLGTWIEGSLTKTPCLWRLQAVILSSTKSTQRRLSGSSIRTQPQSTSPSPHSRCSTPSRRLCVQAR